MSKYTLFLCSLNIICANADTPSYNNCDRGQGLGTVLFTAADVHKQCWSPDEIAILTTRMILEDLLPDITVLNIDSNAFVDDTVNYFRLLIEVVKSATRGRKRHITLRALTDLLGGYLQYAVLPISRHAFYAGLIDYSSMEKLIQLFEELKWFLRTNGQGWSKPIESKPVFEIQPINFEREAPKNVKSCCSRLIYYENEQDAKENNCTVVKTDVFFPSPFFDTKVRPSAIAVPFRRYALRNIESRKAAYLLQKFFISAVQCLKEKRSGKEATASFQNNFFSWIEKEVVTKLHDDKFYSAFGGILRVEETLKNLGAIANSATTCGPEGEEEVGAVSSGKGASKTSKSSIVLLVMLISIVFWFILGTAFICYRMRKNHRQGKGEPQQQDFNTSDSTTSKWSLFSKSSRSTQKLRGDATRNQYISSTTIPDTTSHTSDAESKSGTLKKVCYPPTTSRDKPAVIETKMTMKKLPSITEVSEFSASRQPQEEFSFGEPPHTSSREDLKRVSFKRRPSLEYTTKPCPKLGADRSTSMAKNLGEDTTIDECWCDLYMGEAEESKRSRRVSKEDAEHRDVTKRRSLEEQLQKEHTFGEQSRRGSFEKRARGSFEGLPPHGANDTLKEDVSTDKGSYSMSSTLPMGAESDATVLPANGGPGVVPEDEDLEVSRFKGGTSTVESSVEETTVRENTMENNNGKPATDSHMYACHSSLTGAYANKKTENDNRYIFGYDFQTSSSSEFSDEDTDLRTSTSK